MVLHTVLLGVTVAILAYSECEMIRDEVRPVVETDLQLTAADSDAGNWTANLGDIEVKIEHRHGDTRANEGGSWTLDVARMLYENEKGNEESDNNDLPKEDTEKFIAKAEIPQENTEEKRDEGIVVSKSADEPTDMNNEITDYDIFGMKDRTEIYNAPVTDYPIFEDLRFETAIYYNEDNNGHEAAILDPDNFEYFKGVGWFKLDNRHLNWAEARDACAAVGAHLAVPDTQERVRVFLTLFQRHSDIPAHAILRQQVYVGVSDPDHNRQFITVQGKPFAPDFPIWFLTEPDNAPPGEYCVTFHIEGRTRDVPCFYVLPFFCEKDIPVVI